MSYSRWSNSRWYTFWRVSDATKKEDELFDVDCAFQFDYKRLVSDLEGCCTKVSDHYKNITAAEIEELKGYMLEFIKDVEEEYDGDETI